MIFQVIFTLAGVGLASGGLAKVEDQGEKEKSHVGHPQETNLGWPIIMEEKSRVKVDNAQSSENV